MNKREFIKLAGLAGVAALANPSGLFAAGEQNKELLAAKAPFELPPLPYAVGALEPNIDQLTMEIHHGKHHAGYVKNLNDALKASPLAAKSLGQILASVKPTDTAIRNNGGGHYNHSFFWSILSPSKTEPSAKLKSAITAAFGSDEAFRTQFADAAKGVFGSGWAWLIVMRWRASFRQRRRWLNWRSPSLRGLA
ncbi:superoxide dismutase, partial [Chitinophaga sp.]|uniref:superoxide dismutase n=1 Tax=Chitinophaga sp. TaxID=1869181 RepID=UPI002FDE61A4